MGSYDKICAKCKCVKELHLDNFRFISNKRWHARCRECEREENRVRWNERKHQYKITKKKWIIKNKDKNAKRCAEWKEMHPNYDSIYYENNKEAISKRRNYKYRIKFITNPEFRLRHNLSGAVSTALRKNSSTKNNKSILDFLSYSINELRVHLEKLWEPWMNWNNYGKFKKSTFDPNNNLTWTWQIDHIIPQSILSYKSMADNNFQKCWALKNLRPLQSRQNLLDGIKRIRHK